MDYGKSLIILKEIRKPSGKIFRVWGKTQLTFEMYAKIFQFTYRNLNGKLIFAYFLSHLPGLLLFYTPLEHSKILGIGLGVVRPGLGVE